MVPDNFWQQSQLILTLELFGIIVLLGLITLGVNAVWKRLRAGGFDLNKSLASPVASRVFKVLSLILAAIGTVTLIITVLPGLTPFKDHVNENLELGGLVLFVLWPFVGAQIIAGLFAAKDGWLSKEPVFMWMALTSGYVIFLSVDSMAIRLIYQ